MLRQVVALAVAAVGLTALSPLSAEAQNKLVVKDGTGTVEQFVATDQGSIGIGVPTPTAGLHLKGNIYPNASVKAEGNEVAGGGGFLGYATRGGGFPANGDRLGYFLFGTTQNGTPLHAAGMVVMTDGDWSIGSTPAYFSFLTTPAGSTTRAERMRVSSDGSIGIGTAPNAPTQKLEVAGGGIKLNSTAVAQPPCTDATQRGTMWFTQGGNGVADSFQICGKDAAGGFAWKAITTW